MEKQLRGALIGYGFIGSNGHVPAYLDRQRERGDVAITAIADVCPARRALAQERLPGVRVYSDYESLLAAEWGRLDFIDIATPPVDHARIARAALARGLHVLCEKPLATSVEEANAMLAAATRAKRVIFPCHNYLHAPVIQAVRDVIDSGEIGEVRLVTLNTYRTTHARGVPEWRPDWRRERSVGGGGIAMDHGSHTFYLAFDWLGSYPTSITAKAITLGPHDTEDNFTCSLTFPTGMAVAHLTWTAGARKVIYGVHGTKGAITVDDDDLQVTRAPRPGDKAQDTRRFSVASHWMDASHAKWFNSLFDEFQASIDAKEWVGKRAVDAFHCVQLIEQAYASAAQGSRELRVGGLPAAEAR